MQLDPNVGFADYPEMFKMWQLMDMLPHLYAVFMYTSMVDNAKVNVSVNCFYHIFCLIIQKLL